MQPLKIALDHRESRHGIPKGGLIPVATNLSEVSGKMHELHFFTRKLVRTGLLRVSSATSVCLKEMIFIIACHDLNILQKVL